MERELVTVFDVKLVVEMKNKKNVVDKVPNEILRPILARFDLQFLIAIRAVCKRWKIVIEDICGEKKSIVLESKGSSNEITWISKQFNDLVDLSQKRVILTVKQPVQDSYRDVFYKNSSTLAKLFPQVENLAIMRDLFDFVKSENFPLLLSHWSSTLVSLYVSPFNSFAKSRHSALFDTINKLSVLKRLVFYNIYDLLPSTIAQLEHCTIYPYHIPDVVPQLGVRFTSVNFLKKEKQSDITQLVQLNGLTRLHIVTDPHDAFQVLSFICDHFAALQLLVIDFSHGHHFDKIIVQLAKLAQLSNLSLGGVYIDIDYLARPNLPTLKLVQTFSLTHFTYGDDEHYLLVEPDFDGDLFCRALSTIMPGLVQLTIKHKDQHVRGGILQNVHHFANLRKHEIMAL